MFNNISTLIIIPVINPDWLKIPAEEFMLAVIILFFCSVLTLELIQIRHDPARHILFQSYRTNFLTLIFNDVLMSLLSVSSLLLLAENHGNDGLLSKYNLPLKTLISFVLLDLILYLWHKANHQFEFLWMFHKVHHSDRSMNLSTAFRVHFSDLIVTTVIKALFMIFMGIEGAILAFCGAVTTLFTIFHHTRLSFRSEKWLKWFFIVPSLHRVHHSSQRKEHDSNYGAVLSIWDRIFRTLSELQPKAIGLENVGGQNFFELLRFGFMPVRPTQPKQQPAINIADMVAEAAFYKAELRGFAPGWELQDWLDAEQETIRSVMSH